MFTGMDELREGHETEKDPLRSHGWRPEKEKKKNEKKGKKGFLARTICAKASPSYVTGFAAPMRPKIEGWK